MRVRSQFSDLRLPIICVRPALSNKALNWYRQGEIRVISELDFLILKKKDSSLRKDF